ncbi:hypothetical protein [Mycolicibacterium llatzerense]|uniref:hypothetical protein n=1 Tax=Mycolicibacterium llatzerense TaxID=280871 RepID=UPI0031D2489F
MSSTPFEPHTPTTQPGNARAGRQPVTLELSADEALVLFDWLARTSQTGAPVPFDDPAEQQVLWNLECALERILVEPFSTDYRSLLTACRRAVHLEGDGGGAAPR